MGVAVRFARAGSRCHSDLGGFLRMRTIALRVLCSELCKVVLNKVTSLVPNRLAAIGFCLHLCPEIRAFLTLVSSFCHSVRQSVSC